MCCGARSHPSHALQGPEQDEEDRAKGSGATLEQGLNKKVVQVVVGEATYGSSEREAVVEERV